MLVGYARASARDQDFALPFDVLRQIGCDRVCIEATSGTNRDRPGLKSALDYMRSDDIRVVWRPVRLAHYLKQLIKSVEDPEDRQVSFLSMTKHIDTNTSGEKLVFHIFGALAEFGRRIIQERARGGFAAARHCGPIGGRPPLLNEKDKIDWLALLRDSTIPVRKVTHRVSISAATLHHHFLGTKGRGQ